MEHVRQKAAGIRLVIFDVDGVMTNGQLYYSSLAGEIKAFHVQDGLGIKMLHSEQIETAIITGRQSDIVKQRAEELGIKYLIQKRDDKLNAMLELAHQLKLATEHIAYVGDDLPDLAAIRFAGLGITVSNAPAYIKEMADYQTKASGGEGAVREVCELILSAQGKLDAIIENYRNPSNASK